MSRLNSSGECCEEMPDRRLNVVIWFIMAFRGHDSHPGIHCRIPEVNCQVQALHGENSYVTEEFVSA